MTKYTRGLGKAYNIYCDESCHLENDNINTMVLGAVWCPEEKTKEIASRLREIKARHGIPPHFEAKWTKVSIAKKFFYLDFIDYFFDDDDLHFRALIIPDKSLLRHSEFNQTHDLWYYKMYFEMLKAILKSDSSYRVFLDIKDTCGGKKVAKLKEVLSNNQYDFSSRIIKLVQLVRSHEIEQMQLTDLLIGAVCYRNRGLSGNDGKLALINRIQERSNYDLTKSTLLREEKVNIFRWCARGGNYA